MFGLVHLLCRVVGRRASDGDDDDDKSKLPPSSGLARGHSRQPLIQRTVSKPRVSGSHIKRLLQLGISGRVVQLLPTEKAVLEQLTHEAQSRGYAVTVRPGPDVILVYIRRGRSARRVLP